MAEFSILEQVYENLKFFPEISISTNKHKINKIEPSLVMLEISKDIGNINISDFIEIDTFKKLRKNIDNDFSYWQNTSKADSFVRLFSEPGKIYLNFITPILLMTNVISVDNSNPKNPIFKLDITHGMVTFRDIHIKLLPYLLNKKNGKTTGYSLLSSLDSELITINMKHKGPLQFYLQTTTGLIEIKKLAIQNQRAIDSNVGKITKLLDDIESVNVSNKFGLNSFNYKKIVEIHQLPSFTNFNFDFPNEIFKSDDTSSLPATYPNTIGLWYQINAQDDVESSFCLTSTGTASNTITWTSDIADSTSTTSGVIPSVNSGLPTPLNIILYFFNNVSLSSNYTALTTSSSNGISPSQDVTNFIANNPSSVSSPVSLAMTLGGGNNTDGMWTMEAVYNNIVWITTSGNPQLLFNQSINTICLDVEVGGWTTSSGGYVPFSEGEALPYSSYPTDLISAITAGPDYTWTYNDLSFTGGLIYYLANAGFAIYTTISHSAPYGWYWPPGDNTAPYYGSYTGPIVQALVQCPYINQFNFQLYTESVGTMNEYAYTGGITWTQIATWISSNPNWVELVNAGENPGQLISASVYIYGGFTYNQTSYGGLFYGAGTNVGNAPLMSYNTTGSGCACDTTSPFPESIPSDFETDTGANTFLSQVFGVSGLAGCVQYCNGNFITNLN